VIIIYPVAGAMRNTTFLKTNHKMKLIKSIMNFLLKKKSRPSIFSEAVSDGFKEAFIEMGYYKK